MWNERGFRTFFYLCDERSDEDEEDVVNEESGQEDGADLKAGQPKDFQHVDAEKKPCH